VADKLQEEKFSSNKKLYCTFIGFPRAVNFYWVTRSLLQMADSEVLL
jgi:hypothetical protein